MVIERGEFAGIIGVNGLLEILLPQAARTALSADNDTAAELSFSDNSMNELLGRLAHLSEVTAGKLAKRDVPEIRPDSPVTEAVFTVARGG